MTSEVEKKEEVKVEAAVDKQPQPQTPLQNTEEAKKPLEETPEQINWRRFREERAKERKQKEESDRVAKEEREKAAAFKAALEAITGKPGVIPQAQDSIEEEDGETEDQRIEKKVERLLAQKEAEREQKRAAQEAQELPQVLVKHHPDFHQVCSQENIDYLEFHHPEIATAYRHMPDNLDKWSNLYKAVKKLVPNTDGRKDIAKAEKNLAKPQSASKSSLFIGHGTIPNTNIVLTEERKAANWERMRREMNKV